MNTKKLNYVAALQKNFEALTAQYKSRMFNVTHNMDDWHARRYTGLGGSEMASVLGISQYKSCYELWQEKTGKIEPFAGNNATYWGAILEAVVAKEYAKKTGETVRVTTKHYRSKKYPWLVGNLDRLINSNEYHKTKILECKTCTDDTAKDSEGLKEWGSGNVYAPGTRKVLKTDDCVPFNYLVQVQHYMFVTGYNEVDLAVLFLRTREFRIYTIKRNDDIIKSIIEKSAEFWYDVLTDTEPEMTDADIVRKYDRKKPVEDPIECDDLLLSLLQDYKFISEKIKGDEDHRDRLKEKIKLIMGEHKNAVFNGKVVATYGSPSEKKTVNAKRLKEEEPDIYEKYLLVTPVARALRVK